MVHDRHAIAQLVGLLHVVGGQQDRLALAVELAEDLPQREAALRIEARGRLVEEQHRRAVEDRARHHQPLGHPPGERVHRRLCPLGEVQLLQQLIGGAARVRGGDAEQAPVEVQVLPDVSWRSSVFCWETMPISCLASAGCATTSIAPTNAPSPRSGITRVVSMPAVVVLPAPLGPSRPKISPA